MTFEKLLMGRRRDLLKPGMTITIVVGPVPEQITTIVPLDIVGMKPPIRSSFVARASAIRRLRTDDCS